MTGTGCFNSRTMYGLFSSGQALLPTPAVQELKEAMPNLKSFAAMDQSEKKVVKLLDLYTQCISNGVFMKTTINKLESMGTSAQARLAKDGDYKLLGFLFKSRKKHRQFLQDIEQERTALLGEGGQEDSEEDTPRVGLLRLDLKAKFDQVMNDMMFEDLVGFQCGQAQVNLTKLVNDMEGYCQGFHVSGHSNWRGHMLEESSLPAILTAAGKVALDPNKLMNAPDNWLKDRYLFRSTDLCECVCVNLSLWFDGLTEV